MPHGGGPLGQQCHHNTMMGHPMHTKHEEAEPKKPPNDVIGQAKSYDDIRARISKSKPK